MNRSSIFKNTFAAFVFTLFGVMLSLQVQYMYANQDQPITSPITAPAGTNPPAATAVPTSTPAPTQQPSQSSNNSNNSSNNNSNSNSTPSAPSCNDQKPGSAPKLLSAQLTGNNQVTLVWSKAQDPVTYYLVAYGTDIKASQYGNPNIGGKNLNSYTIKGLNGGVTYYFKVRAGNNCMPGDFSNIIKVKVSGSGRSVYNQPAKGFASGVLGTVSNKNPKATPIASVSQIDPYKPAAPSSNAPASKVSQEKSFFAKLWSWIIRN